MRSKNTLVQVRLTGQARGSKITCSLVMTREVHVTVETQYIGPDAVNALVRYTQDQGLRRFTLVADDRTWPVLGQAVYEALMADGADVQVAHLAGEEVVADGERILEILLLDDQQDRVFVAVGAGTITDLTRFVSHRLGRPFISVPTAPSVDAYTSANAPIVVRRFKRTLQAQQPIAVFADLDVLCAAPPAMIAAGVGDILGKYTALADWRLGTLLSDDRIDDEIVQAMYAALHAVSSQVEAIGRHEPVAIAGLMRALLDSGMAMARWENSRPASGAEHHLSHYWEMRQLHEGRPAVLHGAKVGVGTVLIAREYARLRELSRDEALALLADTPPGDPADMRTRIRAGYGPLAEQVIAEYSGVFPRLEELRTRLHERIKEHWDEVQAIVADVPAPEEIAAQLRAAGAPVEPAELGLSVLETDDALRYAHFMRDRFTIRWLELALGLS